MLVSSSRPSKVIAKAFSAGCSTNAVESLNALPPCGPARGHFPTDQAALNCLYLVTRSLDPTGPRRGTMGHALELVEREAS